LIQLAVKHEMTYVDASQLRQPEEIAQDIVELLIERRTMLLEYYAMEISPEGELLTLPLLLRGYTPELCKLPAFLLRLGAEVSRERVCVRELYRSIVLMRNRWTGRRKSRV
jgi:DNA mismatch repair protein MLH1